MPEYRTSGGLMYYGERGEGPEYPAVLLHAFPLNRKMWAPQVEALAGRRRVITPDYPGFGSSPRPPAQPDVRYYAEQVRELLDRLKLEHVILGGLSMGGYVAFACLTLFPERISTLVLAPTRPGHRGDQRDASGDSPPGRRRGRRGTPEAPVGAPPRPRHPGEQRRRRGDGAHHDARELPRRGRRSPGCHARAPRFYEPARQDKRTHTRPGWRGGRPLHTGGYG